MSESKKVIEDVGQSGINLVESMKYISKGQINIGETAIQIRKAGIDSILIVSITAAFIGLALTTQLAQELQKYGAEQFIGGLISIAVVRELAPVITSIVVAGRVGAAISAEIGSMQASEQIDALSVMGINPTRYLIVPRLVALAVVLPLLTIISALWSVLAGMFLSEKIIQLSYEVYLDSIRSFLATSDIFVMMLKASLFGGAISIIATTTGLLVSGGAEAVGNGATKTVVWSIILIFTLNYIITSIFFGA